MLLIRAKMLIGAFIVLMPMLTLGRSTAKLNVTHAGDDYPVTQQQANATAATLETSETAAAALEATETSAVHHRRILRKAIDIPVIAMDYETTHKPCDMDMRGIRRYIPAFPNQCIWSYNNRYTTEGYYRVYKMYQLEAFFFGQYYERLKRYETEPHNYKEL
ncbi:uncharacterized protein LOC117592162 [Drosophila guanche]|uniref:Secreted protein n=1 Tax=Drosophila guanche TaxID=7266 RepID=A0A3B0IYH4_DROGU|nr:uncharacterized protein LOC117592162 [Drosophila guanche]SPP72837.1 Hypothetical predicted protein [Drosophila guanche]